MKNFKKLKFILPSLVFVPIAASGAAIGSCAKADEDLGPAAKKVTIYLDDAELKDQTEFDIKTTKKLQLSAKVEPADASQDVTFEIISQEGTGNIACSATGIIYPNSSVGTITVRAVSKDKKAKSDPIELIFWDSESIVFELFKSEYIPEAPIEVAYVTIAPNRMNTIEDLCIPSVCTINGKQYDVNGVGYSGFNGCGKLRYMRFPKNSENFWYIGAYSFYLCNALKKITLPDSVTFIDNGAFCNCTALQKIDLGNKLKYVCSHSFENCTNLETIDLPESVTYIGDSAFCQCFKVANFYISKNVSSIGESAFANCWNSNITVDENSKKFKAGPDALYNYDGTRLLTCQYNIKTEKAIDFKIPDSVKRIDARAFEYCENLSTITFSQSSECESIGEEAFALCRNLHNCNLPTKITEIKPYTFSCSWNLINIRIPASVQYIGKHAFYGCDKLENAWFDKEDTSITGEEVTWTILNKSIEPNYKKTNFNVNFVSGSSTEFSQNLAYGLAAYGHWIDPEKQDPNPDTDWVGGFTNCDWTKNSIIINKTGLPVDAKFTYVGFDSINRAAKQFNAKFNIKDQKIEQADGLKLDLVNISGESVLVDKQPVDFYGDVGENTFLLDIANGQLSDCDQIIIKVFK